MPVKVFNETFGRDEEKVFGENTNRSFGDIEVPSVPEFQELTAHVGWLRRELDENRRLLKVESQEREALSERSLDRKHAERVVAELTDSLADTSAFMHGVQAALDAHEKRLRAATERARREVETLHRRAQVSALSAEACLEKFRKESTSSAEKMGQKLIELKVMLEVTQKTQGLVLLQAQEISELRLMEVWHEEMNRGGFWMRLKWLFRGSTSATGT